MKIVEDERCFASEDGAGQRLLKLIGLNGSLPPTSENVGNQVGTLKRSGRSDQLWRSTEQLIKGISQNRLREVFLIRWLGADGLCRLK